MQLQGIYESAGSKNMEWIDPALSTSAPQRQVPASETGHAIESSQTAYIQDDSLLQDEKIAVERAQTWTGPDRFAFGAM